ncbi:helix-turn-helix domain-containing protein [Arthrobacter sp. RT-1]
MHSGRSICAFARELGRSPSTVSREIRPEHLCGLG